MSDPLDDPEKVDAFLKMMFTTCSLADWAKEMSGPELVFWMSKSGFTGNLKWGSVEEVIWEQIESRLSWPELNIPS